MCWGVGGGRRDVGRGMKGGVGKCDKVWGREATLFSDATESLFKLCYESVPSQKYKKFCYIP